VKLLQPRRFFDQRGEFVKTYAATVLQTVGIDFVVREHFFFVSRRGVLRGMHFQVASHDHGKLVYCMTGTVIAVVVDLRSGSPTYGKHTAFDLSDTNRSMAYIPSGCRRDLAIA
jgi:dTDP-4-dehydrorhamnose 3,5-epimerase